MQGGQPSRYLVVGIFVRWGDCDPAGIAFYPRFFEWMDQVSHSLGREMGVTRQDMLGSPALGFPLVSARAEFLAPARLYDTLEVRTRVARIGRASFGLRHEIHRVGDEPLLLARGAEERVHVQRLEGGAMAPRPLTPEMRAVLERYLELN